MAQHWEADCPKCRASFAPDLLQRIAWLRSIGKLRQEAKPERELVDELFRTSAEQFACQRCQGRGLELNLVDDEDDEDWGMARRCEDCGQPIPRERLELFPQTRLCVACQSRDERGDRPAEIEYCPRCGSVMKLAQSRGAGITRYRMVCSACGPR